MTALDFLKKTLSLGFLGQKDTKWAQNENLQVFRKDRRVKFSDSLDEVYVT